MFGITLLHDNILTISIFLCFFYIIDLTHHKAMAYLIPDNFRIFTKEEKKNLKDRVLSSINIIGCLILMVNCWNDKILQSDKLFGYSNGSQLLFSYEMAYYTYDLINVCIHDYKSLFLLHAIISFTSSIVSFVPIFHYYLSKYALIQLTTIFLNLRWYLKKRIRTNPRLEKINGIMLVISYILIRIIYCYHITYELFGIFFLIFSFFLFCLGLSAQITSLYLLFLYNFA